jgi:phage recombination protein Bet
MTQATTETKPGTSLVQKVAARYSVDPGKLLSTLKATAFKQEQGREVSNEQMMALLVVADQYKLNPFTREIYAFFDKNRGIVPVVGVDGFARIISEHEQCDGFEFRESTEIVKSDEHRPCPAWMEVVIYRKDQKHAITVREYFDEVYRPPYTRKDGTKGEGPWQTHSKRMLRHKTLIQGGRIALGFTGAYDEDEALRIVGAGQIIEGVATAVEEDATPAATATAALASELRAKKPAAEQAPASPPEGPIEIAEANPEILRLAIEAALTLEQLNALLNRLSALSDTPERAELMKLWNGKVVKLKHGDFVEELSQPIGKAAKE